MLKVNDLVYDGADPGLYIVINFLNSDTQCRIMNLITGSIYEQHTTHLKRVNKYRVGDSVVIRKWIRKSLNMDKLVYKIVAIMSDTSHQLRYRIKHSELSPMYAIQEIDLMVKRVRNK